jgi:anti-sigma regulatory factor (Ser/Thr protein kinase)
VIEDWGDFDNDHTEAAHDQANAVAQNRDEDGMGLPTVEEVQTYYDSLQPEDITILRGGGDNDETSDQQPDN